MEFTNFQLNIINDALELYGNELKKDIKNRQKGIDFHKERLIKGETQSWGASIEEVLQDYEKDMLSDNMKLAEIEEMRDSIWEHFGL